MSASSLPGPGSAVVPDDALTDIEINVLDYLRSRQPYTFRVAELAMAILYESKGTNPAIRTALRKLNLAGYPIVLDQHGARYSENVDELYRYRESLWQRAERIIARTTALTNIIRRLES